MRLLAKHCDGISTSMTCTINLHKPVLCAAVIALPLVLCVGLLWLIYARFVAQALTAKKAVVPIETLAQAASFFSQSARLQARLADVLLSQGAPEPAALYQAETSAAQAVALSPYNAKYRLLLAAAKSATGDLAAQETHLRAALALAPHHTEIHWRLANLLLRTGQLEPALDEFRLVVTADPRPLIHLT